MLLSFDLLSERMLMVARFSGVSSADDAREVVENILKAPAEARSYHHLYDLSGIEEFDAGYGSISSLVSWKTDRLSEIPKGTICAIYAPGDIAYGMARMYQSISEDVLPFDTQIWRTEAQTLAAVGQKETSIPDLLKALGRG